MIKTVPERMRDAADLFEERNAAYGNNYRLFGAVMRAMYPNGLTVTTDEEWTRLMLQVHRVTKETRYACNFSRGGHADSMADLSVYAQMAAETDEITFDETLPPVSDEERGAAREFFSVADVVDVKIHIEPEEPPPSNDEWRRDNPVTSRSHPPIPSVPRP